MKMSVARNSLYSRPGGNGTQRELLENKEGRRSRLNYDLAYQLIGLGWVDRDREGMTACPECNSRKGFLWQKKGESKVSEEVSSGGIGLKFNERSSLEDFFICIHSRDYLFFHTTSVKTKLHVRNHELDSMTVLLPIHGLADDDSTFHVTGIGALPRFKKILDQAKKLTIFIYSHHKTLAMMRDFTKRKDIVRPGVTRFASSFLTLQSLSEKKEQLRHMFSSTKWEECRFFDTVKRKAAFATGAKY
ncbi:hypothetical protein Tco_0842914 [Tanacetum coccineum]|uniref:Uncharacterized protein n=1 Tax=Tanacetum coccineum TaxID=301880 RepID=A0ABQ5B3C8_9ASTR